MKDSKQRRAARRFAEKWKGRGYEKGEGQMFWNALLRDVLGVERPDEIISFERPVKVKNTSRYIDAYIEPTKVLIEQKSINKDLRTAEHISGLAGNLLPFEQAKMYANALPHSLHPRWIVTCNFRSFLVYDMEHPNNPPEEILLKNLESESYRLRFLVDNSDLHIRQETQISLQAGEIVSRLYDAILRQYIDPANPATLHSLNVLCVRLVFCLYAEDAGVFGRRGLFHDYLAQFPPERMRSALVELFQVLNTPLGQRDPYMEDDLLAAFPYVNGGLFEAKNVEIPSFNAEIANLLLQHASDDFDWSRISPTIFGAVFESTLNPATRREGGMHYTSIQNIHRVIDPLYLDSLKRKFETISRTKEARTRRRCLSEFQRYLASLRFFDPACGSGNFLTETYLALRHLENECIRLLGSEGQKEIGSDFNPILVSIGQFYGIEVNDFAVSVARTALWIAELQMIAETERIVGHDLDYLPLKSYPNIVEGNALRMDWNEVCPASGIHYIMGNPPFVGARIMNAAQKEDLAAVFGPKWKNVGNMDYVSGWYKKAADYMEGTTICAALVSSNSITQGEQVPLLWKPLMADGVHIDFAYRTFRWDSEATQKAHVHCVIIGFSHVESIVPKLLFHAADAKPQEVERINGYLLPMADVFVESRTKPLCDVPEIGIGNKPIDGGNYLFTEEEKEAFIRKEPASEPYFRKWYGSQEFIKNSPRWCLWLGDCTPAELRRMPYCLKRVEAVRQFRLASKSAGTVKLADRPTRFHVENMPTGDYIVIPEVSSEKREYIPIGFMSPDVLCSNLVRIIPNATLYHFGILTSSVHMAWMRMVCGRLEMRYRYSKDIVYNNFPWPKPIHRHHRRIEQAAQGILDARALYPDSSLAALYDKNTMPTELYEAHQQNDRAVMAAYGFRAGMTEEEVVEQLLGMYEEITNPPSPLMGM